MTASVYVLVPTTITDAMLSSSTIAEPDTGETAWSGSSVSYAVGDVRIRTTTHRKYECLSAHTSAASPLPENDETRWLDVGPTNRWACFDGEVSTASTATTSATYVLVPGNFDGIAFFNTTCETITITVKDAPGGTVIFGPTEYEMQTPPLDWWDYAFGEFRQLTKLKVSGIEPYHTAELTIEMTGSTISAGMTSIGDYRSLIGDELWGGVVHGASAEPKSFSQITTALDGTTSIVRRRGATDIRVQVVIPRAASDYCLATLQEVLDVPCGYFCSSASGYEGLSNFGLGSGSLVYDNAAHDLLSLYVKGLV